MSNEESASIRISEIHQVTPLLSTASDMRRVRRGSLVCPFYSLPLLNLPWSLSWHFFVLEFFTLFCLSSSLSSPHGPMDARYYARMYSYVHPYADYVDVTP